MFIVIKFLLLLCTRVSKFKNALKFSFAFGDRSSYFNFGSDSVGTLWVWLV